MCGNKTIKVTLTSEPMPKSVQLAKGAQLRLSTTVSDVYCCIVGGQMHRKQEALEISQAGKVSAECILREIVNWPGY